MSRLPKIKAQLLTSVRRTLYRESLSAAPSHTELGQSLSASSSIYSLSASPSNTRWAPSGRQTFLKITVRKKIPTKNCNDQLYKSPKVKKLIKNWSPLLRRLERFLRVVVAISAFLGIFILMQITLPLSWRGLIFRVDNCIWSVITQMVVKQNFLIC